MTSDRSPASIFGVDFSGATDAGQRIWVAGGTPIHHESGDEFHVTMLLQAKDLPGGAVGRVEALRALRNFIDSQKGAVFGLDFPFSLPRQLIGQRTWTEFITEFPRRYRDPESFRAASLQAAQGREWRRACDREARTPFSAYNIRLYRQTYYGIRDLLAPLVEAGKVVVLPMEVAWGTLPRIIEICPASTLKSIPDLYIAYKGRDEPHRAQRAAILEGLSVQALRVIPAVAERAIHDAGGDALDSIIAAFSTWQAAQTGDFSARTPDEKLEGRVYF